MSFTKIAFVQGLQRSLISAGAIPQYTSPLQAKIAAELAADKVNNDPAEEQPSKDSVTEALTELVEDVPADDTVEAIEAIAQGNELQEALEVLEGVPKEAQAGAAAEAVAKIKQASIARRFLRKMAEGQITSDAASLMSAADKQKDPRPENFAAGNPVKEVKGDVAPGTSKVVKLDTSPGARNTPSFVGDGTVSAKEAAWLLRKLAGGADASAIDGKGNSPAQSDGKPTAYAHAGGAPILEHLDVKPAHGMNEAVAHPGSENGTLRSDKANGPTNEDADKVALAHLLNKTAQEVGHFIPAELSDSDKLAALRTMVGMNNQERAAYLGRIKSAMDAVDEKQEEDIAEVKKKVEEVDKKVDEEKEAALMLRRLGIGV